MIAEQTWGEYKPVLPYYRRAHPVVPKLMKRHLELCSITIEPKVFL